jgi:hypothetical protein
MSPQRALLVVTDGIWDGPKPPNKNTDKAGERLQGFIKHLRELKRYQLKREFTI